MAQTNSFLYWASGCSVPAESLKHGVEDKRMKTPRFPYTVGGAQCRLSGLL